MLQQKCEEFRDGGRVALAEQLIKKLSTTDAAVPSVLLLEREGARERCNHSMLCCESVLDEIFLID